MKEDSVPGTRVADETRLLRHEVTKVTKKKAR